MERRGFLKALAGAVAVATVAKATPVEAAPVAFNPLQTATGQMILADNPQMFVDYTGKFDYIVSPEQKKALDALRSQYPVLKSTTRGAHGPLRRRDIDRLKDKFGS